MDSAELLAWTSHHHSHPEMVPSLQWGVPRRCNQPTKRRSFPCKSDLQGTARVHDTSVSPQRLSGVETLPGRHVSPIRSHKVWRCQFRQQPRCCCLSSLCVNIYSHEGRPDLQVSASECTLATKGSTLVWSLSSRRDHATRIQRQDIFDFYAMSLYLPFASKNCRTLIFTKAMPPLFLK